MFADNHRPPAAANGQGRPGPDGLLLGWETAKVECPMFGFQSQPDTPPANLEPIIYSGEGHLLTAAPTRAGKGRSALAPTALRYPGTLIAIDPKGELAYISYRQRKRLGHAVYIIDPFQTVTDRGNGLNPLDLLTLPGASIDSDAQMLASLLAVGNQSERDPYWHTSATGLITGLIAHIASTYPAEHRNLTQLRNWLYHDDLDYTIAKCLDTRTVTNRFARDQFVAYLTAPADKTRPSIRSAGCSF